MRTITVVATLTAAAFLGAGLWWADKQGWVRIPLGSSPQAGNEAASESRRILYYRNPMGEPDTSPVPKKDSMGMDYIPVYADEIGSATSVTEPATKDAKPGKRVLYYRNPMGLADTSPVPKKDSMGMDYIPVYADEASAPGSVQLSLDKVQRLGVQTTAVTRQALSETIVVPGTVATDERARSVVSLKFKAWVSKLRVAATGARVKAGDPLFDIFSPFILQQETALAIALRAEDESRALGGVYARSNETSQATARARLALYEVPEPEIRRLIQTRTPSGRITWYARRSGVVLEKPIVEGMQAEEGEVLYRLADLSDVWVIADVPERALSLANAGAKGRITLNAYPGQTFDGKVTFVYPEIAMATRTAKVRLELDNKDGRLLPGMFASVELAGGASAPVLAIPENALIDSGERQVVLVARGEGLFEPRAVTPGRRAKGLVEITTGLKQGETVVTSATFLIDAESNLKAALQSFTAGEKSVPKREATQ